MTEATQCPQVMPSTRYVEAPAGIPAALATSCPAAEVVSGVGAQQAQPVVAIGSGVRVVFSMGVLLGGSWVWQESV
jgi:hypothetical protein